MIRDLDELRRIAESAEGTTRVSWSPEEALWLLDRIDAYYPGKSADSLWPAQETITLCRWTYDEDTWSTECGEKWQFTDGTPGENRVRYCHACGRSVTATKTPMVTKP